MNQLNNQPLSFSVIIDENVDVNENKNENKQKSDIIVIFDESGSMSSLRTESIQALDSFVLEQQNIEGDTNALISIYKFNTVVSNPIKNANLKDILPFETEHNDNNRSHKLNYQPNGMTALYDAVGSSINSKLSQINRNKNVCLIIITDGEDNSSREFNRQKIKSLIDSVQKEFNWTVFFLGKDIDTCGSGEQMSIPRNNCYGFDGSAESGILSVMRNVSCQVKNKRLSSYTQ